MLYLTHKDMTIRRETIVAMQMYHLLFSPNSECQVVSPVTSEYSWRTCSSREDWGQRGANQKEIDR